MYLGILDILLITDVFIFFIGYTTRLATTVMAITIFFASFAVFSSQKGFGLDFFTQNNVWLLLFQIQKYSK